MTTAAKQAVTVPGLISLHICIGDLHARAWFGIIEKIAVELLLKTSYVDQCICVIFPSGWKYVPIISRTVAILTILAKFMSPFEGVSRRRHDVSYGQPEVCSLSPRVSDNTTAVYRSTEYSSLCSRWAVFDRVPQQHGGEASIGDCPWDDGHIPGMTLPGLRSKPLGEPIRFHKNMVFASVSIAPAYIVCARVEKENLRKGKEKEL